MDLIKKYGKKLHVCHVSTAEEIKIIKKSKEDGLPITCETACHYLFLTADDVKEKGSFAMMKPRLGSKKDQQTL